MDVAYKIMEDLSSLALFSSIAREQGEKIVLTSGCFDLLHGGHLHYVCDASKLGMLIVGINSDKFVKKLKGEGRPVRGEYDRAFTMAGFAPVSGVVVFDCDYDLIEAVKPDIYVVSSTSHLKIEEDAKRIRLLDSFGCQIVQSVFEKQDSTTDIIRRASPLPN